MATGKPDITQLEALVAQGRHQEALDGYQRLLAGRPNDPLLRARVDMLRDALSPSSDAFAPAGEAVPPALRERETDMRTTFVVTPEEVADSYVVAGRYDDALLLLEKAQAQRPGDRAIADRIEKVRALKRAGVDAGAEATTPQQSLPPPRQAPRGSPRAQPAPAFGTPRSSSSLPVPPRTPAPVSPERAPTVVASERAIEALRTAAASPSFGQPRSSAGSPSARRRPEPAAQEIPVGDRTVRSPPPRPRQAAPEPVGEATVISPPPERESSTESSVTSADLRSGTDEVEQVEERTAPERRAVRDIPDAAEDAAKTVLAPPPTGLSEAFATGDEVSGGFASSTRLTPVEPTRVSPPPEAARRRK